MSWLAYPFWNATEQRVRALGRLILHMALFVALLLLAAAIYRLLVAAHRPAPTAELILWVIAPVLMIVSAWIAARWIDRRPFADLGLHLDRAWWIDFSFGLALGALMMSGAFLAGFLRGWFQVDVTPQNSTGAQPLPLALFLMFCANCAVGGGEELLSRGYQLRNMAEGLNLRRLGPRAAVILSLIFTSAIFAALHLHGTGSTVLSALNTFIAGILLAIAFVYTGRLALPIGIHITWNFAQGCVFGLPVSSVFPAVALLTTRNVGPDLWTGGSYGPEGGLLGTGTFLAAIAISLAWIRMREGRLTLRTNVAEYRRRSKSTADTAVPHTAPTSERFESRAPR